MTIVLYPESDVFEMTREVQIFLRFGTDQDLDCRLGLRPFDMGCGNVQMRILFDYAQ